MVSFVFHGLIFLLVFSAINTSTLDLSIQPKGVGSDQSHYLATVGSQLSLQCELNATNVNGVSSALVRDGLQWMRGQQMVDSDSLSVFTQSETDPDGNWVRKTLIFPQVNNYTTGTYRCAYFEHAERHAHIHLIEKVNWRLKSDIIGAQIGTPLTIDCGTDEQANVTVKIMDEFGRAIEESPILEAIGGKIYVTGHEMTIEKLERDHRGMKIRCFAIRTVSIGDKNSELTIRTDERNLTIDVWEAPHFVELDRHFYKQQGASVVLLWRVRVSNPPVINFTLKKDGKIIVDEEDERRKFTFKIDGRGAMALLNISKVTDDDYGQYTCIAHNGKMTTDQNAFLDKPNPPNQPLVWPLQVTNTSVQWHVEEQTKVGQLPVSSYRIAYKPIKRRIQKQQQKEDETKQNLVASMENDMGTDDEEDNGDFWQQRHRTADVSEGQNGGGKPTVLAVHGDEWEELKQNITEMTAIRQKNAENTYDIGGLQPFTLYEFAFVAFSEAGNSDPVTVKQETTNDWVPSSDKHNAEHQREDGDAASSSMSSYVSIGLLFGLFTLASIFAVVYCLVCGVDNAPVYSDEKCRAIPAVPVP